MGAAKKPLLNGGNLAGSSDISISHDPDPEDPMWMQRKLRLSPAARGFHLITREIVGAVPELASIQIGWMQVFIQHTSASLTVNENADPDVRVDFETAMNHAVPESLPYVHTLEGPDDMPAHVKASMLGAHVS